MPTPARYQHPRTSAPRTRDGARVLRLAVAGAGLYRGIGMTTLLADGTGIGSPPLAAAVGAAVAWSGLLIWDGWQHTGFRPGLALLDVVFASAVGLYAFTSNAAAMGFGFGLLQAAAIVAGCALPLRGLAVALPALLAPILLGSLSPQPAGGIAVVESAAYAATLLALALAAAVAYRLLHAAADAADRRHTDREPGSELAEHRRLLHDTALATLTAIAGGKLDPRTDRIRARCARDAAYLRLIAQGAPIHPGSFSHALATAGAEAEAVGLRVHRQWSRLPELDPAVVAAIAGAAREALNNVHRHAGTPQAWLTATDEDGHVVVRIVDRGTGLASTAAHPGSGIQESIHTRMRDVGGAAQVELVPGEGTVVELRWPD